MAAGLGPASRSVRGLSPTRSARGFGDRVPGTARGGRVELAPDRAFLTVSAALFIGSALATVHWCGAMSDADGMPMPGAWTMSMAWMRTSEHTRLEAGAAFLAMWMVMMLAMMLPPAVLMLWSYRRCVRGSGAARLGRLTLLAGAGYFFVWAVFGVVAYALGAALAEAEMRWSPLARSVPLATGVILLLAGALQLTAWKIRQLARCADAPASDPSSAPMAWNAWRRGLRLGMRCSRCCAGLMLVLLVTDVMSLGAMAMVAGAITLERFVPRPQRAARVIGVLVIAAGVLAIARALPG